MASKDVTSTSSKKKPDGDELDLLLQSAGFGLQSRSISRRTLSSHRGSNPNHPCKVKVLSLDESLRLASQGKASSSRSIQRRRPYPSYTERKSLKPSTVCNPPSSRAEQQQQRNRQVLSPEERVRDVMNLFRVKFEELERDHVVWKFMVENKKQVNTGKRIGHVPGINVGDTFQYKTQLNLVGLHFGLRSGIDYMQRGGGIVATSVVYSEGSGYDDRQYPNVVRYVGEGGNVSCNDQNLLEDQKLVKGNLALYNSSKEQTPVRVIKGENTAGHRGYLYTYRGLFLVEACTKGRGVSGKILYTFTLRKQP